MRWASKILLISALGIVCYTGVLFGIDLYQYSLLSSKAPITVARWEVKPVGEGTFAVEATFTVLGKERQYQFVKPVFKNSLIAKEHAHLWQKKEWEVFFHPQKEVFVLQKFFPFMEGIHFVLSIGIALWFVYLFESLHKYS